jgi:hypothetical protein
VRYRSGAQARTPALQLIEAHKYESQPRGPKRLTGSFAYICYLRAVAAFFPLC